jgi:hypothetical protein
MGERGEDERGVRDPEKPEEPSFLTEVSFATKLAVVVTLLSIAGYFLFLIVDMFL